MTFNTFELVPFTEASKTTLEGTPYRHIRARILIDGKEWVTGLSVDFVDILAFGAALIPDEEDCFYPFTCSCGVPGCVDLHEGVTLVKGVGTIEWRLPMAYYSRYAIPQMKTEGGFGVLTFNKAQYRQALKAATVAAQKLVDAARKRKKGYLVGCTTFSSDRDVAASPSFFRINVLRRRRGIRAYVKSHLQRKALYGKYWAMSLEATSKEGNTYRVGMVQLLQSVGYATDSNLSEADAVLPWVAVADEGPAVFIAKAVVALQASPEYQRISATVLSHYIHPGLTEESPAAYTWSYKED